MRRDRHGRARPSSGTWIADGPVVVAALELTTLTYDAVPRNAVYDAGTAAWTAALDGAPGVWRRAALGPVRAPPRFERRDTPDGWGLSGKDMAGSRVRARCAP